MSDSDQPGEASAERHEPRSNGVWTNDGFHYVFDWWKTLDRTNPFIYRDADWLLDKNAVQFVDFSRF